MGRKYLKSGMLILMFLAMVSIAYGACVFLSPTASQQIVGTTTLINVSCNTLNVSRCNITGSSTATGASFSTGSIETQNFTGAGDPRNNESNITTNLAKYQDATDWSLAGTCYNATSGATVTESITAITVTLDNTLPVEVSSSPSDKATLKKRSQKFSTTCYNTTSAKLFYRGVEYTMEDYPQVDNTTCEYTMSLVPSGTGTWYMELSDGLNTTTTSTYTLNVRRQGGGGGIASAAAQKGAEDEGTGKNKMLGYALLGGIVYFAFFRKKKK